jgi:YesN/AraC family two-component response regulator
MTNLDYKAISDIFSRYDNLDQIKKWFIAAFKKIRNGVKNQKENRHKETIRMLKNYIDKNFCDPNISVKELSDKMQLSPNYLRVLFKDSLNISISDYISNLRFEKAKQLLSQTDYPAAKIAELTGYSSSIYFHSAFKKMSGKSPDEFRKSVC